MRNAQIQQLWHDIAVATTVCVHEPSVGCGHSTGVAVCRHMDGWTFKLEARGDVLKMMHRPAPRRTHLIRLATVTHIYITYESLFGKESPEIHWNVGKSERSVGKRYMIPLVL